MNPELIRYIEQNRDTYTREAIDKRLLDAGYSAADIEAAWAAAPTVALSGTPGVPAAPPPRGWDAGSSAEAPRPRRVIASPLFWITLIGFVIGTYALPYLAAFVGTNIDASNGSTNLTTWGGCGTLLLIQLAALIGGIALLRRNRPVAQGLFIGLLIADVVIPLIILGACVVLLTSYGFFGVR
jgi:hypothetical protein